MICKGGHDQRTWKYWEGNGRGQFQDTQMESLRKITNLWSEHLVHNRAGYFRSRSQQHSLLHTCNWFIYTYRCHLLWINLTCVTGFLILSYIFMPDYAGGLQFSLLQHRAPKVTSNFGFAWFLGRTRLMGRQVWTPNNAFRAHGRSWGTENY